MAISYGSITIVDITDIGEFSIYPQCNLPLSVIYDPNEGVYSPDWGAKDGNNQDANPLILTPVVYYAGEAKPLNTSGLSITWTKQVGIGAKSSISSANGENVNQGVLTVNKNQFAENINMISYICTASYIEPDTQQTLIAEGRITFSLVRHASKVKRCDITGGSVFKYSSVDSAAAPATITLTATLNNVTNGKWQYYDPTSSSADSDGYVDFPIGDGNNTSNTSTTIVVTPSNIVYNNNVATIRKLTSDANTYDITTIVKLYDGAAGDSNVAASLTNEYAQIPCDSSGNPTIALSTVTSTFTIYEGGEVASGWTYNTPTTSSGISGSWNSSTHTWSLSSWSTATGVSDSQTVTFSATKDSTTLTKVFNLIKIKTGKEGASPIYYELNCSSLVANNASGVYAPSNIILTAKRIEGATSTDYRGYIKIYKNDSSTAIVSADMDIDSKSYSYSLSGNDLNYLTVELYQTGGSGDVLDRQTIAITRDGEPGPQGEGGLNVVLQNPFANIPCNTDGTVKANTTISIPFTGYKGTNTVATTITTANITGLIANQINCTSIINATTTTSGNITLVFVEDATLNDAERGTLIFNFNIEGSTVPMIFSWSKNIQAADGENAIVFQCYAPGGDIIENGENNVTLSSWLTDGAQTVVENITYQWYQYNSASSATDRYDILSGETSRDLTVTPNMITGYGSFKCIATYKNNPYVGYVAVRDKSDPIQVQLISTLGEQLLNGVGDGAVYARLFRNGTEIDGLKTTNFSTVAPTSPVEGSMYYALDSSMHSCRLMKYTNNEWVQASGEDLPEYTYTWTFRDKNGDVTTYGGADSITGKAIYIGASVIDKKLIIDCEVSKSDS